MKKSLLGLMIMLFVGTGLYSAEMKSLGITASIGAKSFGESGGMDSYYDYLWVGLQINLSDEFTIRPAFLASIFEEDKEVKIGGENPYEETENTYGAKCGFFYSFEVKEKFNLYFGPEILIISSSRKQDYEGSNDSERESLLANFFIRIGGQYMFSEDFGVFGDIGFGLETYNTKYKSINTLGVVTSETETNSTNFRTSNAVLGAVLFF